MGGVLRGEDGRDAGVGPVDAEGGIVEAEAALGFLAVEVVALVGEERVVLEDDEAVGEAAGDEELAAILGGEEDRDVFAEGGGTLADVHGDIPDGAAEDADEFGLGVGAGLPVEAADDAAGGAALVVLDEVGEDVGGFVAGGVVGFAEVTAGVCKNVGDDDFDVGDGGGEDFHVRPRVRGRFRGRGARGGRRRRWICRVRRRRREAGRRR